MRQKGAICIGSAKLTGQTKYYAIKARPMMFRALALSLLLTFAGAGPDAGLAAANLAQVRPAIIDKAEIDKRASRLMHQLEMVGMSIALVEDGKISFAKGYGEEARGSNRNVTPDTVFRWASVSKGIAAATILSLEEEGALELAQTASLHAPSLNLPKAEKQISIEDMLAHKVGIVRNAYDNRIEGGKAAKETRSALRDLTYLCAPSTCHTYQNVAYDASSEIVETVTGLPYKAVVHERIFKPLGMSSASLTLEGLTRSKSWAKPHGRFGNLIRRVKPNYYRVPAAAGVNSSVKDLARWMIAQMPTEANGALPAAHQEAMQQGRVATPREQSFLNRNFKALKEAQYGLGWRVYDYNGHKVVGHRGGVEGYRALILFDPARRSGIAMMWNSPHTRPIGLQMEFMDQLYGLPKRDWLRLGAKG